MLHIFLSFLRLRLGAASASEQLTLVNEQPALLSQEDESWEQWLPLHHASRWGTTREVAAAALLTPRDGDPRSGMSRSDILRTGTAIRRGMPRSLRRT